MIELKKCPKCKTYLIPLPTKKGNIYVHLTDTNCEHKDLIKSIEIDIIILDEYLYEQHQETFGTSTYDIEDVFKAYDQLKTTHQSLEEENNKNKEKIKKYENTLPKRLLKWISGYYYKIFQSRSSPNNQQEQSQQQQQTCNHQESNH